MSSASRSTPLQTLRHDVEVFYRNWSSDYSGVTDAVYVSAPITTGHRLYAQQPVGTRHSDEDLAMVRALNTEHALRVVERVRLHYRSERVIDPLTTLSEPDGWKQDDFNGFWMTVIENLVSRMVLVDGWQFSTGCTWEVGVGLRKGCAIMTEDFEPLPPDQILRELGHAQPFVSSASWTDAVATLRQQLDDGC